MLDELLDRYLPAVAALAREALRRMRKRLPGAWQLVYDNYNALAIGFSPTAKTGDAVLSIALYPRWVTLFFLHGAGLRDPRRRLVGTGVRVRHVVLKSAADIDDAVVADLIDQAVAASGVAWPASAPGRLEIRSVSANQRPRRPPTA